MEVGLIGCGDMGKLYARKFAAANYRYVNTANTCIFVNSNASVCVCDLPEKYDALVAELEGIQ